MRNRARDPGAGRDDAFLTRGELSKALGIGKTTLRRWETEGKVRPVTDANGVRLYPREEAERLTGGRRIATLPKARALVPNAGSADGELAAKIFDRLDRGVHPVEIVKELIVHPDIVEGLLSRWARLRKTIVLTEGDVAALGAELPCAVGNPRELVSAIQILADRARSRCEECERRRPAICNQCMAGQIRATISRTERRLAGAAKTPVVRGKTSADGQPLASGVAAFAPGIGTGAPNGSGRSQGRPAAFPTETPAATTSERPLASVMASSAAPPSTGVDGLSPTQAAAAAATREAAPATNTKLRPM